jgi:hypothetical protein
LIFFVNFCRFYNTSLKFFYKARCVSAAHSWRLAGASFFAWGMRKNRKGKAYPKVYLQNFLKCHTIRISKVFYGKRRKGGGKLPPPLFFDYQLRCSQMRLLGMRPFNPGLDPGRKFLGKFFFETMCGREAVAEIWGIGGYTGLKNFDKGAGWLALLV